MDGNPVTTHSSAKNSAMSADGSNTRIGGLSGPDYVESENKVVGVAENGVMESLTTKPFVFDQRTANGPQYAADMDHLAMRTGEFVNFINAFEHALDISSPLGAVVAYIKTHLGHGLPQWAKDQLAEGKRPPSVDDDEVQPAADIASPNPAPVSVPLATAQPSKGKRKDANASTTPPAPPADAPTDTDTGEGTATESDAS